MQQQETGYKVNIKNFLTVRFNCGLTEAESTFRELYESRWKQGLFLSVSQYFKAPCAKKKTTV
jgi:hypothetical protein